jgi:natural product biosynthesis luciferase-like monooxygenase protein
MTADPMPADGKRLSPERQKLLDHLLRDQQETARALQPVPARGPAQAQNGAPARPAAAQPRPPQGSGNADSGLAVSLFFFSADLDDDARDKHGLLLECAELADRLGLHALWVPERHFDPFGAPYPSPAILLAAIAARTRRIALRAGSVVLPLHDPLLVAEEWGVLDSVSQGRAGLSLASGWHADDFVLAPDAYEGRKNLLIERLNELRRLWQGGPVARLAPGGRTTQIRTYPQPRKVPEIWLTSSVNVATWRTAGELGLNVLTALLEQSVDEVAAKIGAYRQTLAAAGHSPAGRQVTLMLHTHLARDPAAVRGRVREPLTRYLAAHMDLFAKFAASQDIGIRAEDLRPEDREALLEHGFQRYLGTAGLFGSVQTCRPMVQRLASAGVTELGCLVDFGLSREHVLECVEELGHLQRQLQAQPQPLASATGAE